MTRYAVLTAESFEKQFLGEQDYWYAERDKNPFALDDQLPPLFERLAHSPWSGARVKGEPHSTRTLPLAKTAHRVAYEIDDEAETVTLLAIWGMRERRRPKLR